MNVDDKLQELLASAGSSKDAKVAIINIKDTQLMYFLKEYYPEVWDEFKKWRWYMVHGEGAKSSAQFEEEDRGEVVQNMCILQKKVDE